MRHYIVCFVKLCLSEDRQQERTTPRIHPKKVVDLPNVLQITPQFFSGAEPKDKQSFQSLAKLGIKTIVSVDGARPNVALADDHGIRYVHIPVGYDAIPKQAVAALVRVARDCERPIYVHCHHGRHRGPAAAAILCMAADKLTKKEAVKLLKLAETSPDYAGLWRDVQNYQPPKPNKQLPLLVAVAKVRPLTKRMAKFERLYQTLYRSQEIKWANPDGEPTSEPTRVALLMFQELREAKRFHKDEEFQKRFGTAATHARRIQVALKAKQPKRADVQFLAMQKQCTDCHAEFR